MAWGRASTGTEFEPSGPRSPQRATATGRNTHGVPDVRRLVETQLAAGFPHRVWVAGRVGAIAPARGGGAPLEFLLDAGEDEELLRLPCVVPAEQLPLLRELLDRVHDAHVEDVVCEGRVARAGGLLRFDAERNRIALLVSELDPEPTARGLAEDRESVLATTRAARLAERQRIAPLRPAPLRVGLVAGFGDPAAARVEAQLTAGGFAVQVRRLSAPLHGAGAPSVLADQVREAAWLSDVVLVVREQGRPMALAAFDSEEVARAVADAPVPVVTGLGTGGGQTVCDEVALLSCATAHEAGQWVLDRLSAADGALQQLGAQAREAARGASERARWQLDEERAHVVWAGKAAEQRAERLQRTRWRALLTLCAVLAVVAVGAAVLTARPLLLLGLLLPAALLLGYRSWTGRIDTRRSRPVSEHDEFAEVLAQLREIREDLDETSRPEQVHRLRDQAAQLVRRGEALLREHLEPQDDALTTGPGYVPRAEPPHGPAGTGRGAPVDAGVSYQDARPPATRATVDEPTRAVPVAPDDDATQAVPVAPGSGQEPAEQPAGSTGTDTETRPAPVVDPPGPASGGSVVLDLDGAPTQTVVLPEDTGRQDGPRPEADPDATAPHTLQASGPERPAWTDPVDPHRSTTVRVVTRAAGPDTATQVFRTADRHGPDPTDQGWSPVPQA